MGQDQYHVLLVCVVLDLIYLTVIHRTDLLVYVVLCIVWSLTLIIFWPFG